MSPVSSLRGRPGEFELLHFFGLTFAITWGFQLPPVLMKEGVFPGNHEQFLPLVVLGIFGPAASAYWLVRKDPVQKKQLLESLFTRSPGWAWMTLALITPGALLSLGLLARFALTSEGPLAYPIPPERIFGALLISLCEEIGWRGYALPRLSRGLGRTRASVLLGVVWTIWHIPMLVGQEVPLSLLPVLLIQLCAGSLVFSWFYFKTGGSLLIAVLLHLGVHLNNSHLALPGDAAPLIVHTIGWVLLALALLLWDRRIWLAPRARRQETHSAS